MAEKRLCRSCKLYDLDYVKGPSGRVRHHSVARCGWKMPSLVVPSSISPDWKPPRTRWMEPNDGADCPCWESAT